MAGIEQEVTRPLIGVGGRVRSFNLFLKSTPAGVAVFGMSRYHDHMVKDGGDWRIRSRVNRISYASGG
ncbi:MAG TPA: nuclear transport factor 2 family protein [Thermoleophilaceae bacterium]